MLKQRLLTALIAIPVVAVVVLFAPAYVVGGVLALLVLGGAWEWAALAQINDNGARASFVLAVAVLLSAGGLLLRFSHFALVVSIIAGLWWVLSAAAIVRVNAQGHKDAAARRHPWWVLACGVLVLWPAWVSVMALQSLPHGSGLLLFLLVLIWGADAAAYAAGRLWGQHRLAPVISPGKTWEGVAGALVAAVILGLAGSFCFSVSFAACLAICLITVAMSIVGDLFESLFKRRAGIKDSGTLFPGHGGVLDRVDSLSAAAPVFLLCWLLWGI